MEQNKNNLEQKDYGQIFFNWKFKEFTEYERGREWYIGGSVVVVLLLIFSVWTNNFLFGLLVVMTALIVLLMHRNNHEVNFKITEDGILLNTKLFEYKDIQNFYIIYSPPEVKTLYFEPKKSYSPRIPIFLDNQDPTEIRKVLKRYLDEDLERENEPLSDQFGRRFKL